MVGTWVPPPRRPQKNLWGPVAGCRDPLLLLSGVITAAGLPGAAAPPLGRPSTPRCTPMSATIRAGPGSLSPAFEDSSDLDCGCPPTIKNPCEQVLNGGACSSKTAYKLVSD